MSKRRTPRRDRLRAAGMRLLKLKPHERERFGRTLGVLLDDMGERDMPKFDDVFRAIRTATIKAKLRQTVDNSEVKE